MPLSFELSSLSAGISTFDIFSDRRFIRAIRQYQQS